MSTVELYKKCNELATIRNKILMLIILGNSVFAEEREHGNVDKGGLYEFSCKVDEVDGELQKYIDSYSDKAKEQVGL